MTFQKGNKLWDNDNSRKTQFKKGRIGMIGKNNPMYGKHPKAEFKKGEVSGKNNLFYGKHHTEKTREILRSQKVGKKYSEEINKKKGSPGEKNPNWQGGISKEPYDQNWTPKFRRAIRKRDNQVCMLCGIHREKLYRTLDIHHINYDKKMSIPQNCISLCVKCHMGIVHGNKKKLKYWTKFFQSLLAKEYDYQYSLEGEIILNFDI